jgi:uncharacterized protein
VPDSIVSAKHAEVIYITSAKYFAPPLFGPFPRISASKEPMQANAVTHNAEKQRFEVAIDGQLAFLEYKRREGEILFTHTEVPEISEGHGVGTSLAKTALDYACDNHLEIVPLCEFVIAFIRHHPEYLPLVSPRHRSKVERHAS